MNICIEPINETHFEELISLFKEFAVFEKLPEKMENSVERMLQEKELLQGYIAKDPDNTVVGYATFFFAYYTWSGKALYMDDLYVKPIYRGIGIGTSLIKKVIDTAKEQKCNKMRWQVSRWNNNAIQFYKNMGAVTNEVEMNCDLIL